MCGGHYLALARAAPGMEEAGRGRSGEPQEERGGGPSEGTWEKVAERNAWSCGQVGWAVGVVSAEVSEEPLQWEGDEEGRVLSTLMIVLSSSPGTRSSGGAGPGVSQYTRSLQGQLTRLTRAVATGMQPPYTHTHTHTRTLGRLPR